MVSKEGSDTMPSKTTNKSKKDPDKQDPTPSSKKKSDTKESKTTKKSKKDTPKQDPNSVEAVKKKELADLKKKGYMPNYKFDTLMDIVTDRGRSTLDESDRVEAENLSKIWNAILGRLGGSTADPYSIVEYFTSNVKTNTVLFHLLHGFYAIKTHGGIYKPLSDKYGHFYVVGLNSYLDHGEVRLRFTDFENSTAIEPVHSVIEESIKDLVLNPWVCSNVYDLDILDIELTKISYGYFDLVFFCTDAHKLYKGIILPLLGV